MSEFSDLKSLLQQAICRVENGLFLSLPEREEFLQLSYLFNRAVAVKTDRRTRGGDRRALACAEVATATAQLRNAGTLGERRRAVMRRRPGDRRKLMRKVGDLWRRVGEPRRKIPDRRAPRPPNS